MKMPDKGEISSLSSMIDNAGTITVSAHQRPDGDAIGVCISFVSYLVEVRGKDAVAIFPDKIPSTLQFIIPDCIKERVLIAEDDIEAAKARISSSDMILLCDCNGFHRTGSIASLLEESCADKALIDHHVGPERECFNVCLSDEDASSACENAFWIMKEMEGDVSKLPLATRKALLTGMTTDTNNFANSTSPSTFEMASLLIDSGVDREEILSDIYNSYPERRFRALGYLLSTKLQILDNGLAYMVLSAEEKKNFALQQGETEGFVNMPLSIDKVKVSIFLREDEDKIWVSIRSKRGYSARRVAVEHFNGGGHELASGGKLLIPQDIAGVEFLDEYIKNIEL